VQTIPLRIRRRFATRRNVDAKDTHAVTAGAVVSDDDAGMFGESDDSAHSSQIDSAASATVTEDENKFAPQHLQHPPPAVARHSLNPLLFRHYPIHCPLPQGRCERRNIHQHKYHHVNQGGHSKELLSIVVPYGYGDSGSGIATLAAVGVRCFREKNSEEEEGDGGGAEGMNELDIKDVRVMFGFPHCGLVVLEQ